MPNSRQAIKRTNADHTPWHHRASVKFSFHCWGALCKILLIEHREKSKLYITDPFWGESTRKPCIGFPAQSASNTESVTMLDHQEDNNIWGAIQTVLTIVPSWLVACLLEPRWTWQCLAWSMYLMPWYSHSNEQTSDAVRQNGTHIKWPFLSKNDIDMQKL